MGAPPRGGPRQLAALSIAAALSALGADAGAAAAAETTGPAANPVPASVAEPDGQRGSAPAGPPLGRLEQESVDEALIDLGIRIDPHPEGKIIRAIHVVNQEVFSKRDWWFRWFNIFHRTTRSYIIERELLVRAGQAYDGALVEESVRNLQATSGISVGGTALHPPELSSVIVILPIVAQAPSPSPPSAPAPSPGPALVDLLVVTRDVWSLRFNTNFEFQQNTLSLLATSFSENNLFGWRKFLSFGFSLDLGAVSTGPTYFDPNVAGTRLTLYASAKAYYGRATHRHEGDAEALALVYPLFSLASRWGGGFEVVHQDTLTRLFRGTSPRSVNLIDLDADGFFPALEPVPYVYRRKVVSADLNVVRQFGRSVVQRVTIGHLVDSRRSRVPDDFPDPDKIALFLRQVAPVSETRSEPYVQYDLFTPRYGVYRDLNTFDLRENLTLGPVLSARVAVGMPELGADFRAFPVGLAVGWRVAPRGGFGSLSLAASARLRDSTFIDQRYTAKLYFATRMLGRFARLVVAALADTIRNDTKREVFGLGGDTGLRGYAIGDFLGTSEVLGHVELRTVPGAVFSQRFGGLLFYDVGDAAPSFAAMVPKHDLGVGLRWLIPQFNSSVLRMDWAFATQSTTLTRAGFPGRLTAGYQQVFQ